MDALTVTLDWYCIYIAPTTSAQQQFYAASVEQSVSLDYHRAYEVTVAKKT